MGTQENLNKFKIGICHNTGNCTHVGERQAIPSDIANSGGFKCKWCQMPLQEEQKPKSFWQKYGKIIISIAAILALAGLCFGIYNYFSGTSNKNVEIIEVDSITPGDTITPPPPPDPLIQSITVDKPSITLNVGESAEVSVSIEPENFNEEILVSSSDENVAEFVIDEGMIVANKAGQAVITFEGEKSGKKNSVNVTVNAKPSNEAEGKTRGGSGYGTANLSYGTYKGELKNGQPHGHGTVTFTTTHRIVSSQDYIAHPGDRYEGEWRNGVIAGGLGYWYHDGNTTGIRP